MDISSPNMPKPKHNLPLHLSLTFAVLAGVLMMAIRIFDEKVNIGHAIITSFIGAGVIFVIGIEITQLLLRMYFRQLRHTLKSPLSVASLALEHAQKKKSFEQDTPVMQEQIAETAKRIDQHIQ